MLTVDSRIGIYGFGPHGAGGIISYSILFSTLSASEVILVHYGHGYSTKSKKDMFTVTLKNGTPQVYISETSVLRPKNEYTLNDDSWHHIAVSMPKGSCALSEVVMYVDGKAIRTKVTNDEHIFFTTSGRLSIGGFGYSHDSYEEAFPHLSPYIGKLDEFYLWGRYVSKKDLRLARKP